MPIFGRRRARKNEPKAVPAGAIAPLEPANPAEPPPPVHGPAAPPPAPTSYEVVKITPQGPRHPDCACDVHDPKWAEAGGPALLFCPHSPAANAAALRDRLLLLMAEFAYEPAPGDVFTPLETAGDKYAREIFGRAFEHATPEERKHGTITFLRYAGLSCFALMLEMITEVSPLHEPGRHPPNE